jgi:succinate dehydrogenase/fumarate reductase flavoprotein subunit
MARSTHDMRLCHEMKHKVLSAEMKLRAGLERKESRGSHYRADYPYRNDDEFLCYIAVHKAEDGSMEVGKAPVKDEWKGDTTLEYSERYDNYYPGEVEAKGLHANSEG